MIGDLGPASPVGWSASGRTTLEIKTGAWRTRRPAYVEATAPCRSACPAGEPIARWMERARFGDLAGAWALIRQENPFPAIMGRVCAHPCEAACNRGHHDTAVAINALERFVGDWGLDHGTPADFEVTRPERVAVVGGGPAGLSCVYHLSRLGYPVHLYEAQPALGGVLRYGIPEYRLPRAVLDREIELAIGSSVKILTQRRLGENLSWNSLRGYGAIFVGVGAAVPLSLRVPGEDMRGIGDGLSFLRLVNSGARPALAARLVVVGGGSTAMDVARSARRLGVGSVTVLAIEARGEMPALPEEVTQTLAEGVEIVNGFGVSEFAGSSEGVTGVVARPARLSRDENGAVRARFEPGQPLVVETGSVLLAIGQRADLTALPADIRSGRGLIAVDASGATRSGHVFAGGDAASTERTVTHAVAAGARAARGIHARLSGRQVPRERAHRFTVDRPTHVVAFKEINRAHFNPAPRAERRERPAGQRVRSFIETVGTLGETVARAEMARCFICGHCTLCDTCSLMCPDMAIHRQDGGYRVAAEHCKGCGLCVEECPRGALHMVNER